MQNKEKNQIDVHADDFGLSESNANKLIESIKLGYLDSISIIPTFDCFECCMKLLMGAMGTFEKKPRISIHIDLVDGRACASNSKMLVDNNGLIISSWGSLFFAWLTRRERNTMKKELTDEIEAQIRKVLDWLPDDYELRIDSHMHTHMIPLVADAMWKALDRIDRKIEFVRVAKEPLLPFVNTPSLWVSYAPVNIVKNLILNIFSKRLEGQLKKRNISQNLMWGLIMSGKMDYNRVSKLLHKMIDYAKKKNKPLEILFHPAGLTKEELLECHNKSDIYAFYLSDMRSVEHNTIVKLKLQTSTYYVEK